MSLRAQLVIFGALVPTALLVAAVIATGGLFERSLLSAVDDAIRTQAAIEAVSLFDGPDGRPHVHLGTSPLGAEVDHAASDIAVYDVSGERVASFPLTEHGPRTLRPADVVARAPETRERDGRPFRELSLVVRSPEGAPYAIWLGHDLTSHEATLSAFRDAALLAVALAAWLLLSIQLYTTGRLHRRIDALVQHVGHLHDEELPVALPDDGARDELGVLRQALSMATEKLRAARSAQERLVADAAHELRTPLATMRAAIEVTLRRERNAEDLREALEGVRTEVSRLSALSTALLDLATLRARETERLEFDLAEVTAQATDAVRGAAEARAVTLSAKLPSRCAMRGSPREVRQAIDNLLANALAHAPRETAIDVTVEDGRGRARVVVRDRGPGVPTSEREAIFEPFHRVHPLDGDASPGAGLGLAIVRDVARRHGGHAFVADEPGPGAAIGFEIELAPGALD